MVAETKKLRGNTSFACQLMDRSNHTMTKHHARDEKTHKAIKNQCFERLFFVAKDMYEVELVMFTFKQGEPIIVDFVVLHCKVEKVGAVLQFFR